MHEKSLLGVDSRLAKASAHQAVFQPVPADMARQILLSGPGEEISAHFLAVIGAPCPGGSVFGEVFPEFAVVKRDKKTAPVLAGANESLQHRNGAQRQVDMVVLL